MATDSRGGAIVASATVLLVAMGFAFYAGAQHHGPAGDTQNLHGRFVSANGLSPGALVMLGGVRVGTVRAISLDKKTQMAQVDFAIDSRLRLPKDSVLGIGAPTMTSENALQITPGHDAATLASGDLITHTRDQVSLEQQVSNYIFGGDLGDQ